MELKVGSFVVSKFKPKLFIVSEVDDELVKIIGAGYDENELRDPDNEHFGLWSHNRHLRKLENINFSEEWLLAYVQYRRSRSTR